MKRLLGGCLLIIAATSLTYAQSKFGKLRWDLRLNETRGPIRREASQSLTSGARSEILGGPTNGFDKRISFIRGQTR